MKKFSTLSHGKIETQVSETRSKSCGAVLTGMKKLSSQLRSWVLEGKLDKGESLVKVTNEIRLAPNMMLMELKNKNIKY